MLVGVGWGRVVATACGVGPAGCSDNPDGDEGDLQTRPLTRGRSEIGRRGDRVSSDDDGKTPGGPGLRIGMGKMINVAKNSWGKRSGLRAGGPLHKGDGCEMSRTPSLMPTFGLQLRSFLLFSYLLLSFPFSFVLCSCTPRLLCWRLLSCARI